MKILSIRNGFQADHSSTSYEFFAVDKPLTAVERQNVSTLSSRARPTKRRVSFIYHSERHDLPGGWEPLLETSYDVMYRESYDWWTLGMAFDADQKTMEKIVGFEYTGIDDMGVYVEAKGSRVMVSIHCRMDPGAYMGGAEYEYEEDYYEGEEEDESNDNKVDVESGDMLLDLLAANRELLKKGDYRLLYGVMEEIGYDPEDDEEDETPPVTFTPEEMEKLPRPISEILSAIQIEA